MAFRSSSSVMFRYLCVLLDVGVAAHQLDADIDSIAQEPAGPLVTEVAPVQVDLPQLGAIDARTGFRALRVVAVGDEQQGFPCRLEVRHELAGGRAEHERAWAEGRTALEDRRQPPLRVERNAAASPRSRITTQGNPRQSRRPPLSGP